MHTISIRQSYDRFPAFTSRFWTWLTGKPAPGQRPVFVLSPIAFAGAALLTFLSGVILSTTYARTSGRFSTAGVVAGWCLTVNGARRMVSTVNHQCIHGRFSGRRSLDRAVANLFALLTLTETPEQYRLEHFKLHHRDDVFTTVNDPAAAFLSAIGIVPGATMGQLWRRLAVALVSPYFHSRFIIARIRSNIMTGGLDSRILFRCFILLIILICTTDPCVIIPALVGYGIPIIFLYQNSILLEFVSEHAWFSPADSMSTPRLIHATHSWGRFCGGRVPKRHQKDILKDAVVWAWWIAEHLLYHLPVRILILPGDLSQHDFHHRNPATLDWTQACYARERDLTGLDRQMPPYQEFWGLHTAINHVFERLSGLTPISGASVSTNPQRRVHIPSGFESHE